MHDVKLVWTRDACLKGARNILALAPVRAWKQGWGGKALAAGLAAPASGLADGLDPGHLGTIAETRAEGVRLIVGVLPDRGSRHNSPTRIEAIGHCTSKAALVGDSGVLLAVDRAAHGVGASAGVSRELPIFDAKTGAGRERTRICLLDGRGRPLGRDPYTESVIETARQVARLVDTPTAAMTTADLAREIRSLVKGLPRVTLRVISGDGLRKERLGGIEAVGRAARVPPRLVVLDYRPDRPRRTVAIVGKGIVYDTGGLSLKIQGAMSTMKADMAGAAAVAGAFRVLVRAGCRDRVLAFLALAENSIGPDAYRPDDILTLHSGHTVEINNTDAEGRLVLGDAVSYAARRYKADVIIDAATLTGAQLVSTGERHAAVVSNRQGLEDLVVSAGRATGDLTFPLVFAPEFHRMEFESRVADMKNSVKNRANAQSSCAAWFVYAQIDDLDRPWLHVDMAGPAHRNERGTGYGVALLAAVVLGIEDATLKS